MSVSYSIDNQISKLTAEIFKSAAKINKSKENKEKLDYNNQQREATFSINNFAISYLHAESLFNVQQIGLDASFNINNYAYNTYNQSHKLLKKPDVLIDFMHKNNRTFDYMV